VQHLPYVVVIGVGDGREALDECLGQAVAGGGVGGEGEEGGAEGGPQVWWQVGGGDDRLDGGGAEGIYHFQLHDQGGVVAQGHGEEWRVDGRGVNPAGTHHLDV